jgi:ferritin-like metal-binding protein YciE
MKMKIQTMQDLFVEQIEDLYDAEHQLVKALPKMAKAATSPDLREAFESHLEQTKGHVERLEKVFATVNLKPKGQSCPAMRGLVEEGDEIVSNTEKSPLRDAGLIAAANRVEHYEIAAYGTARAFALTLGIETAVDLLQATLDEEVAADAALSELADSRVNDQALAISAYGGR